MGAQARFEDAHALPRHVSRGIFTRLFCFFWAPCLFFLLVFLFAVLPPGKTRGHDPVVAATFVLRLLLAAMRNDCMFALSQGCVRGLKLGCRDSRAACGLTFDS